MKSLKQSILLLKSLSAFVKLCIFSNRFKLVSVRFRSATFNFFKSSEKRLMRIKTNFCCERLQIHYNQVPVFNTFNRSLDAISVYKIIKIQISVEFYSGLDLLFWQSNIKWHLPNSQALFQINLFTLKIFIYQKKWVLFLNFIKYVYIFYQR